MVGEVRPLNGSNFGGVVRSVSASRKLVRGPTMIQSELLTSASNDCKLGEISTLIGLVKLSGKL